MELPDSEKRAKRPPRKLLSAKSFRACLTSGSGGYQLGSLGGFPAGQLESGPELLQHQGWMRGLSIKSSTFK